MLVDEIKSMNFETNKTEDKLRQIPEIVLHEKMPELHRNMWYIVQTVLNPIFFTLCLTPVPLCPVKPLGISLSLTFPSGIVTCALPPSNK